MKKPQPWCSFLFCTSENAEIQAAKGVRRHEGAYVEPKKTWQGATLIQGHRQSGTAVDRTNPESLLLSKPCFSNEISWTQDCVFS